VLGSDAALVKTMGEHGMVVTPTCKLFRQVKDELSEYARKHPLLGHGDARGADADEDDDSLSSTSSSSEDHVETEEEMFSPIDSFDADGRLLVSPGPVRMDPEQWSKLLRKYAKPPTNELERDREQYFTTRHTGKTMHVDDCRSETDLMMLQRQRYVSHVHISWVMFYFLM